MCRASISASRLKASSITAWTFSGLTGGLTVIRSVTPTTPLTVNEPGFGGGHLAVGGEPERLTVCRPDVDRAGPPREVDPGAAERAGQHRGDQARPGQHGGLDDTDV